MGIVRREDEGVRGVQVYDLEGRYLRTIGEGFLSSPSGFVLWEDTLVIAELYSRLSVLDAADKLIGYIGDDPSLEGGAGWPDRPGWPSALTDEGYTQAPLLSHPDRFNSPHCRGRQRRQSVRLGMANRRALHEAHCGVMKQ
jgi:hypothetical protein